MQDMLASPIENGGKAPAPDAECIMRVWHNFDMQSETMLNPLEIDGMVARHLKTTPTVVTNIRMNAWKAVTA